MKQALKYYLKEFLGFSFLVFGGVYLIKYLCSKESFLVVLNYHSFSKYNNFKIQRGSILESGYAPNFENQMKFLDKNFNFLHPREFFGNNTEKGIKVFITFDDGYKDNYDIAFPILNKHRIPAAFFIVSSIPDSNSWLWHDKLRFLVCENELESEKAELALMELNKGKLFDDELNNLVNTSFEKFPEKRLMMNWKEIKEIAENGFVIGSHTHTHSPLKFLNIEERAEEINESIKTISSKLKIPVNHFAYPNGLYDEDCNLLITNSGIKNGYTTKGGLNRVNDSSLEIKRIGVNVSDSIGLILLKIIINFRK